MKKLKVLLSVLLSAMLVLSLLVPVMAEEQKKGTITISDAFEGKSYTIYRILDIESYGTDAEGKKIATYKPSSDLWETFIRANSDYVSIDGQKYVTWVKNKDVKAFVKAAIKFAEEHKGDAKLNSTTKAATGTTVEFDDLKLGYYLLDTTTGSICSIDSTVTDVTLIEKNTLPTIIKKVKEDSTKTYGDSNTADIGQTVDFKATITAYYGAQNYIMHDKMDANLLFKASSVKITDGTNTLVKGTDYVLNTTGLSDGCTFEIEFKQTYLDGIGQKEGDSKQIIVEYQADVLTTAEAHDELTNTVSLKYGDGHETEEDTTKTYVFDFKLEKIDGKAQISGAEFELYLGENMINLVKVSEGNYRIATPAEVAATGFKSEKIAVGLATITGLDAATYTLKEVTTPKGYNTLASNPTFVIGEDGKVTYQEKIAADDKVIVVNTAGALLPETGGTGTKVLFTVGGIMMVVAFVLITSKRRMAAEK